MRILDRLKGFAELLLLAAIVVGWGGDAVVRFDGGGGGGFTSGFTGRSPITVQISADKTTLPVNIGNAGPRIGGPYTNTIKVTVMQNGNQFATPINVAIASGLSSGALYYLDGDPEHEQCPAGATCPPTPNVPIAYRQVAFDEATGIVTFHFNSSSVPGTVQLVASATDPQTGKVVSANLTITVTGGGNVNTGGKPAVVKFLMDATPVYIRDNPVGTTPVTQNSVKIFQIFLLDDFGQPINQGAGNPLRIELLPNRPNGGEWLSATGANGSAQEGTTVLSGLFGGAATVILHAGTLPGTVTIAATADRADNNVDNGIQTGITNYASVPIGTGEIKSLTFTGPFADAVATRQNSLAALVSPTTIANCTGSTTPGACDTLWNGIYTRFITVIASDPYGNPPPAGTPITFRLIDSPLDMLQNRYPDQGHGQFAITSYKGDPQEGGWAFFAPNRTVSRAPGDTLNPFVVPNGLSLAIADPGCSLFLQDPEIINPNSSTINALPAEGRLEYHVGSRIIKARAGNTLTVNTPFNQVGQNVGANVWYTVGCPPYKGNVLNFDANEVNVMTDINGVASTVINYPANQVGRRFMVAGEANGGKVGAVMTHWYLGISDNSILALTAPLQLAQQILSVTPITTSPWPGLVTANLTVPSGTTLSQPITLQLLDGGVCNGCPVVQRTPIPGVPISVDVIVTNPAETTALIAEDQLAQAQAALDAFDKLYPGVCTLVPRPGVDPVPDCNVTPAQCVQKDPAKCALRTPLQAAVDTAQVAAIQARAVADLHHPKASVVPTPLASGASGYANAILIIEDLPPALTGPPATAGGTVDFYFSTVGPEVRSQTLQIHVTTPQPAAP